MKHFVFEEENLQDQNVALQLLESYRYWGRKRLVFNIVVGLAGLGATIQFSNFSIDLFDVFGMIAWGVVANGLYTFGFLWESVIIIKSKGARNLKANRNFLFWVGTLVYVFVSIFFASVYFLISN
jgi:hypothetical protein